MAQLSATIAALAVLVMLGLSACSEPERAEPVVLELPRFSECLKDYGGDNSQLDAAIDRGKPDAIVCALGYSQGLGMAYHDIKLLYRYYRATGREPERLDRLIRSLDRYDLALSLWATHEDSPELTPFARDRRGCPVYDPIALELIMRVEMGEETRCVPRRRWWR